MRINHNIMAMNTHRQLGINGTNTQKSIEKLSSGMRINKAGDDAAGLAISEKMRGQIRGLGQASRNSQDGISMIQTAEGSLSETQDILQRMRELAVQSSNETLAETDREKIQSETDQLAKEVTRIANTTEFNTKNLLNGGLTSDTTNGTNLTFHIGANKGQSLSFGINAMDAQSLGVAASSTTTSIGGAGDVTATTVTGSAAAVTDGNVVTATTTTAFGGSVAAGATQITGTTATEADSVVNGASIDISVVEGNAADVATKTGSSLATLALASLAAEPITLGGTNVTLTNVIALGDGYDTTDGTKGTDLATALQSDINAADGGSMNGDYAVTWDTDHLVIKTTATGSTANVTLGDNASTGTLAVLGLNDTAATGSDADYNVTFDDGTTSVTVNGQAGDAASVSGTGVYSTLSFTTGGTLDATTAGTIDIATVASIALSDGAGHSDTISGLATDATSASGSGDFAGFELTLDGALANGISSTITLSVTSGSAATIDADGTVHEAVADAGIDVSTATDANNAIDTINTAINTVSAERSKLGSYQNRLEHTIKNLDASSENLVAAESRIRDVDMAKEMMEFTKNNILQQAAQSMLAQANQQPQGVLQLLR